MFVAIQWPWTNWAYLKGGLEMKRMWGNDEAKTRFSQGSMFIQHCIYIGQAHRPHPLFQLYYIANLAQQAVCSSKFL